MTRPTEDNSAASIRNSLRQSARSLAASGEDADEVQSSFDRQLDQMNPRTDLGMNLVFRIFVLMLRLKRFVENEARALTSKGVAYDDSPEATKAQKAEAATSRELFRTIKEFRLVEAAYASDGGALFDAIPVDVTTCQELGSFRSAPVEVEGVTEPGPSIEDLASFCPEPIEVVEPSTVDLTETSVTEPVAQETGIEMASFFLGTRENEAAPQVTTPPTAPVPVPSLPEIPPRISFLDPSDPPRSVGWNGYQQF